MISTLPASKKTARRAQTAKANMSRRGVTVPARRFTCARCHICISAAVGMCEDCEKDAPLIQHAAAMGQERFCQTRVQRTNFYADAVDTEQSHSRSRERGAYRR